jgi:hypothetical protein
MTFLQIRRNACLGSDSFTNALPGAAQNQEQMMKYMLMMQFPLAAWKTEMIDRWPEQDRDAHFAFLKRFNAKLIEAGEFVRTEGLGGPAKMRVVRAGVGAGGGPEVSDGPFAETKEVLAGYWLVDVKSPERAYELAAEASAAPGPGGKPLNMPIEVHPVEFQISNE